MKALQILRNFAPLHKEYSTVEAVSNKTREKFHVPVTVKDLDA